MKKTNNFIWIVVGVIILLLVLSQFGILKKKETNLVGLKVHYYNNGVEVFPNANKGLFSIVSQPGQPEQFINQMSFDVVITNNGNVKINNTQIIDAYPQELKNALSETPFTLNAGDSKIIPSSIFDTSTFEHYPQPVSFWVKIKGTNSNNGTIMNAENSLQLNVLEQIVLLRFEKSADLYPSIDAYKNSWLAYDYDGDSKLEGFGSFTAVGSVNRKCSNDEFIANYGDWIITRESPSEIKICKNQAAPSGASDFIVFSLYQPTSLNAVLDIKPLSSYVGREIYTSAASHTCGNNIQEPLELCDGTDLGGNTCATISQGFVSGNLACNSCTSWNTAGCNIGTVKFRTTSLLYTVSNIAIAYSSTCAGALVQYGKVDGASCTDHYCDATDQTLNVPSLIGTTKMWVKDANTLCICSEDKLGAHTYSVKYSATDPDASKVSTSKSIITPDKEVVC